MSLPTTQTAYVFTGAFELEKRQVEVPKPEPGNVLLKIEAAGVCHSDIHILHGSIPFPENHVLGHEIVGRIVAYGEGVNKDLYPQNSLYAAVGVNPCGTCEVCRTGHDNVCESPSRYFLGLGAPGGYEEYTQVPSRNITRVPDGIPPAVAASATDATLTPYHALKGAGINGLTRLLIIGLGGLGINAVQIAKAFGSYVIAVDPKESSRELAKKYGADEVYAKLPDESLNVDVASDFYGAQSTFDECVKHVKTRGTILPVGLQSPKLSFDLTNFAMKEFKIFGNYWGSSQDQIEVLDLIKRGIIKPEVETTPMSNINQVMKDLDAGKIKSRMALVHELK